MSVHATELPVFLCHGAGADAGSCTGLARALDAQGGLLGLALSYPGRADVPGPPRESVTDVAAYVSECVVARLGSAGAPHVVLGHSMGGAVALEYALTAPAGLRALVLVSTGARLRVHPSILAALRPAEEGASTPTAEEEAFARSVEPSPLTPRATALADWRAADAFDRMAHVHEVHTPTLILVGDADQLTPLKYARFLHERIAGSQLMVVPGAGHSLPTEQRTLVAQHVAAFLSTHVRAEAPR